MKIVILDGYTLNPGDLDWTPLKKLGRCVIYERTAVDQIVERAHDADIVLTNKTVLAAETLEQLTAVKYIGVLATGVNVVDLQAAEKRNIVVTNVPGYSTDSVAQMVFALLLEMTQRVGLHDSLVKQGDWVGCEDFSFRAGSLMELAGKTIGIVGFGQIGRRVAQIAEAFGMKVLVHTANPEKYQAETKREFIDIDKLFSIADVISLNCPLTETTEDLVNTARLARIKEGALLVNTGRGQLINEEAVAEALEDGYLGGYATDVLSEEPPDEDNPLLAAPNCYMTPHIAWATVEARQRLLQIVVENIIAFQNGTPQNRVA